MDEYDNNGRLKYHPEYHDNRAKSYTTQDLIYICSNYVRGNRKQLSMATGRTESSLAELVRRLKKEFMGYSFSPCIYEQMFG